MTTLVQCEFIGGPKDGQSIEMRSDECAESLELKSNGWIAVARGRLQRFDQHVVIPEPRPLNWHSYVRSVYLRVHKLHPTVIYWYMHDQLVERCQSIADDKQCMNEAMPGLGGCVKHPYGPVMQRRFWLNDRRKHRMRVGMAVCTNG